MRNLSATIIVIFAGLTMPSHVCAAILFQDDFDDGYADHWREYDGPFNVVDGAYRLESTNFWDDARSVAGESTWTDYIIDVDVKIERSDYRTHHPAILFRVQNIAPGTDAGRYYQFYIYPDLVGFAEINYSGGNASVLATTPYVLEPRSDWHHIELEVEGATARAIIDDTCVLSYEGLTRYSTGMIGLKTINDGVVLFDNVVVTPEPATVLLLGLGSLSFLRRPRNHDFDLR